MDRRLALKVLAGTAVSSQARGATTLVPSALDHVECWVTSAPASAAFYARVFGNQVLKNQKTERRYVRLGSAYLAVDQGQAVHVDHICAGIPNFRIDEVHEYLSQQGVPFKDYPSGRDTAVNEPGGQRLQLAADHGWEALLTGTAAPEPLNIPGAPVFTPTRIESVLLRVPDLLASTRFFQKLLGEPVTTDAERWFTVGASRLGLRAGDTSGVEYLQISARAFDPRAALDALNRAGATQAKIGPGKSVEFTDPDRYPLRVISGL